MMANNVNYQNTDQRLWGSADPQLGIFHRNKEDEEKGAYYNENWMKDASGLEITGERTDFPSPAHSIDSLYDQASTPATTDSDDGYEKPVIRIDHVSSLDSGVRLAGVISESGKAGKKAKCKPVPKKRKNKSALQQDSTYCLAKSDSSLDSIDMPPNGTQNPKKALSRQKVIYPVKGGSGQVLTGAREPRKRSRDHTAEKKNFEAEPQGVPVVQKQSSDNHHTRHQFRHVRSNSITSDKFEDALEYLPDDWVPAKPKGREERTVEQAGGSNRSKGTHQVAAANYEEAWDLNPSLEAKLSSLKLMHSRPEVKAQSQAEGNYQEPWDLSRKQQELEARIQQASKGRGEGDGGRQSSSFRSLSPERKYRDVWRSRSSASLTFQPSHGAECSGPSPATSCTLGSVPSLLTGPVSPTDCLQNQEWYHGSISRVDAERMLRVCKEGSFLVRDSSNRLHYTLSIKSSRVMIHIQIEQSVTRDGSMLRYILGHHSSDFPTIPSMIHHYTLNPVPIKDAEHIRLLYPVPRLRGL
ncbi:uncharacterized protein LOC143297266 [Babylonia areolata]|uniref:uncharacterized protein LOC143297266 n=1 Tax=Babylonia areolata TaxID=304850 RepID=UPI003FD49940